MATGKPFYNVDFWEFVFEREKQSYTALVMRKAKQLKALESKNLFQLSEADATKIQQRINILTDELNVLYGFKLFTDEMRNCYVDSIDKIYEAYSNRALLAEAQLYELQRDYSLLYVFYESNIDTAILLCETLINKMQSHE